MNFLIAPQEHWCHFNNISFGVTLLCFEVFPSNKTLFNYKAGSTPQDTSVSIITLVIILCLKQHAAYCYSSQQSSKSFDGRRFLHKITDASGEYFTYSVHVESKLQFNLIGNLEQPWKITGLFCFCFCFLLHSQMYQVI